jgi:hypothetical protein
MSEQIRPRRAVERIVVTLPFGKVGSAQPRGRSQHIQKSTAPAIPPRRQSHTFNCCDPPHGLRSLEPNAQTLMRHRLQIFPLSNCIRSVTAAFTDLHRRPEPPLYDLSWNLVIFVSFTAIQANYRSPRDFVAPGSATGPGDLSHPSPLESLHMAECTFYRRSIADPSGADRTRISTAPNRGR